MTILGKIEQHLRATQTPPSRFGREACKDPRLVGDLRNGREPSPRTVARIEAFMAGSMTQ
jgi:hypothetical protein